MDFFEEPVFFVIIDASDVVEVLVSKEGHELVVFGLFTLADFVEVGAALDDVGGQHEQEILFLNGLFGRPEEVAQHGNIAEQRDFGDGFGFGIAHESAQDDGLLIGHDDDGFEVTHPGGRAAQVGTAGFDLFDFFLDVEPDGTAFVDLRLDREGEGDVDAFDGRAVSGEETVEIVGRRIRPVERSKK